jgi:hypothetical protein
VLRAMSSCSPNARSHRESFHLSVHASMVMFTVVAGKRYSGACSWKSSSQCSRRMLCVNQPIARRRARQWKTCEKHAAEFTEAEVDARAYVGKDAVKAPLRVRMSLMPPYLHGLITDWTRASQAARSQA